MHNLKKTYALSGRIAFNNACLKYSFTLLLLFTIGEISTSYAQIGNISYQCRATSGFPDAPASLPCSERYEAIEIFLEDFDEGFGIFAKGRKPGTGTNGLTISTNGDTPSLSTGPITTAGCYEGRNQGEFVYLEGSKALSKEAHCMSGQITLPSPSDAISLPYMMSFWYHMFGDNIGTMEITINSSTEFTVSGQQQKADYEPWRQGVIDLSDYAGTTIDVQICMSEGDGMFSDFESDISLDHIQVFACQPSSNLPPGWAAVAIGNNTGGYTYDYDAANKNIVITANGNKKASAAKDELAYAHMTLCGNGMITAEVEDVAGNAFAGLMIRERNTEGAKQVSVHSDLNSLLRYESRTADNVAKSVTDYYKPSPGLLRLERQGDWIFAYSSSDGINFKYIRGINIPMEECVEVGLCIFSDTPSVAAQAMFGNVEVVAAGITEEQNTLPETEAARTGNHQSEVMLFPNPATNSFTVLLTEPFYQDVTMKLRSRDGQLVESRVLAQGEIQSRWDTTALLSGLYYLEVSNEGGLVRVMKVVKQ